MLNPNREIKKWFFTTIDGLGFDVYDGIAPDSAGQEYIILDDRSSEQQEGKTGFTSPVTINVDIVTKNANFGYKRAEDISDDILTAINSNTQITLSNGFYASSLIVSAIRNLDGLNPLENVFRTIITYKIIITQN